MHIGIRQLTDVLETDESFTVVKTSTSLSASPSSLDEITPGSQPDIPS